MWKEAVLVRVEVLSLRYQEGLNETTRSLGMTGLRAKIWSRNLSKRIENVNLSIVT